MSLVDSTLEMWRLLGRADDRLQAAFRGLLLRYFQFLNPTPTRPFLSTRWLRMRTERDRRGRIRRLAWTIRRKAIRLEGGRVRRLTRRLTGRFRRAWVYTIAKDWRRVEVYEAFERERSTLNGLRSQVLNCLLRLRFSFEKAWAARATWEDRREAERFIVERSAYLTARDLEPVAGLLAFERAYLGLERELGRAVDDYRRVFARSLTVSFEPALRPTKGGALRLYWGFPERVATSRGTRTFTDYLPGRPTDALMRKLRIPERTRREVGAFQKRLLPVERRYRALVGFLGNHRRRVYELEARMAKLGDGGAPAAGRGAPRAGGASGERGRGEGAPREAL
jgi:hypothetical protein